MNELLAKFKQLDSKTRTIGLGVLLLVIFLLDFLFLIRPQFSQFIKIGKNVKELRGNIDITEKSLERSDALKAEADQVRATLSVLQDRFIFKDSMNIVLERIALIASHTGVDIVKMEPDVREPKVLLEKNGKRYLELSVSLEAHAKYHDFGRFINQLETDELFIRMEQFSMTGSAVGPHNITMVLKAMMLDGDRVIPDQAAALPKPIHLFDGKKAAWRGAS